MRPIRGLRTVSGIGRCFISPLLPVCVSELVGVRLDQLSLHPHCSIHVLGKGRRERILPLWKETAVALRAWLAVRGTSPEPELFLNARHGPMTRSGFEYIFRKHVQTATTKQPSLTKKRVSPHVLRHTCAMRTLQATGDIRKVALWLGHSSTQSTEIYVRADPSEKLEALVTITPPTLRRGRFSPPDKLLALLRPERR
jgi:integrase/recombinase XerD